MKNQHIESSESGRVQEPGFQADTQQDLNDARALIEQSVGKNETKKYRKAAEIILRKVLNRDPENEEAKALLQYIKGLPAAPEASSTRSFESKSAVDVQSAEGNVAAEVKPSTETPKDKKITRMFPYALVAIGIVTAGILWRHQSLPSNSTALAAPVSQAEPLLRSDVPVSLPSPQALPVAMSPAMQTGTGAAANSTAQVPVVATPSAASTPTQVAMAVENDRPAARAAATSSPATGTLAVSSPIAAEIYSDGKYLASTPASLKLSPGRHTLEYRHGDLRTVMTHEIKANETVAAPVTFLIPVQVNARPWAQVYLDGLSRQSLGQTPLSSTNVPIGGVLVFEHPDFPAKKYRVTDKDTTIQIIFP